MSNYKSKKAGFRILLTKITLSLPDFIPNKLNTKLYQQFGSLSVYDVATEEKGYASYKTSETGSPLESLLDDKVCTDKV